MAIPEKCNMNGGCGSSYFVKDEGGYKVFCSAGIQGGCSGPSVNQLKLMGHQAAVEAGTARQTPPLRFTGDGQPVTRKW